jgi:RNA polymerase sigma-70 factor (ECF subfamily)
MPRSRAVSNGITRERDQAPSLTDAQVIALSVDDPELFSAIYERYAATLYRYAFRRLGEEGAEDVVASAFLAAFRARRRYDYGRPEARPWLFGILTREIAQCRRVEAARYRALARAAPADPAHTVADGFAERVVTDVAAQAARGRLGAALAGLPARDRDTLLITAWAGLSYEEAALALGIPVGTVRSRLNRARRRMRDTLGGADPTGVTGGDSE